jgi:transcriptional regulator with XRE-family HTH domain
MTNTDQVHVTGHNSTIIIPDVIYDFGGLLRDLRLNHGFSQSQVSKKIGVPITKIHLVENNKRSLPSTDTLRDWLLALGCGIKVTNRIIIAAKNLQTKQYFTLNTKETANPDIVRIIQVYNQNELTDYDRCLLALVGRHDLKKIIS